MRHWPAEKCIRHMTTDGEKIPPQRNGRKKSENNMGTERHWGFRNLRNGVKQNGNGGVLPKKERNRDFSDRSEKRTTKECPGEKSCDFKQKKQRPNERMFLQTFRIVIKSISEKYAK